MEPTARHGWQSTSQRLKALLILRRLKPLLEATPTPSPNNKTHTHNPQYIIWYTSWY